MTNQTHYETLEVIETASPEVIRSAYKYLSQKWHPDKNAGNSEARGRMQAINVAYAVLSDPEQRAEYDSMLRAQRTGQGDRQTADQPPPDEAPGRTKFEKKTHRNEGLQGVVSFIIFTGILIKYHPSVGWGIVGLVFTTGVLGYSVLNLYRAGGGWIVASTLVAIFLGLSQIGLAHDIVTNSVGDPEESPKPTPNPPPETTRPQPPTPAPAAPPTIDYTIHAKNSCSSEVKLAVAYVPIGQSRLKVTFWWEFQPGESAKLEANQIVLTSESDTIYFYAQSVDGDITWRDTDGSGYVTVINDEEVRMRKRTLKRNEQGQRFINMTCPNAQN